MTRDDQTGHLLSILMWVHALWSSPDFWRSKSRWLNIQHSPFRSLTKMLLWLRY